MLDKMRDNSAGWFIKALFAVIILAFVFTFSMTPNSSGDPVMATVNDQIITIAEYEITSQRMAEAISRANPQVSSAQFQSPQFKQMVLGELVSKKLLLAEAEKLGIGASDKEIIAGIAAQPMFKNTEGKFDSNIYQAALRQIRMTPTEFEADFKEELLMNKVKATIASPANVTPDQARQMYDWVGEQARIDYIQVTPQEFTDSVTVNEDEIKAFFEANAERFTAPAQVKLRYITFTPAALAQSQDVTDEEIAAYYEANKASMQQEEQVNARHIIVVVKEDAPESAQTEAKKKIEKILEKVQAGEDFSALAKGFSEGPSAPNGGALGWVGRGVTVPEFEKAAFETKKGEFTGLVKTQFGWHIIKVEDRKDASTKSLEDSYEEVKAVIAQEKASEKITGLLDQAMDRLVSGMSIEEIATELKLTPETSEPMPATFLAQLFGMTADASTVLEELPAGKAHQTPVAINGGYMLVEKVEDIAPALISIERAQPTIINALKEEKSAEMAKNMAEKMLAALTGREADQAAKTYASRIQTSEPFERQGNILKLGASKPLADAAFAAKDDAWLPQVYTMSTGVVVARLNELIPASEKTWEEQKDFWMQQASQNYQQEMLAAFMDELSKTADIEIARQDLLQ